MESVLVTFILFYLVDIEETFVHHNEVDFWSWLSFGPFRPSILKTHIITNDLLVIKLFMTHIVRVITHFACTSLR